MTATPVTALVKNTRNRTDVIAAMCDIVHLLSEKAAIRKARTYILQLSKRDKSDNPLSEFAAKVYLEAAFFKKHSGNSCGTPEFAAQMESDLAPTASTPAAASLLEYFAPFRDEYVNQAGRYGCSGYIYPFQTYMQATHPEVYASDYEPFRKEVSAALGLKW